MRKRIVKLVDKYELSGLKRVICCAITPIIYGLGFVIGYAKGMFKALKNQRNKS